MFWFRRVFIIISLLRSITSDLYKVKKLAQLGHSHNVFVSSDTEFQEFMYRPL
jgi:hypothetical protein